MMNFSCSTCLESFTPLCDISTTPCGHVFHTGCITKWLNKNRNCSQCRKHCIIQQIIKLYFSESQSGLDENITLNELEQKRLKLEDKSQRFDQELSAMKKLVDDKSIEISQTNQKCNKLEHEKLLMKKDWSKTEWNLKGQLNIANKQIKDLEKEVIEANGQIKDIEKEFNDRRKEFNDQKLTKLENERMKASLNNANKQIKDLEKEVNEVNGQIKDLEKEFNDRRKEFNDEKLTKLENERNLKKSIDEANKRIKDLEKEVEDQKWVTKTAECYIAAKYDKAAAVSAAAAAAAAAQAAKEKRDMNSGPQQSTIEYEKMELAYGFPPFPYPIPTGVDPSMHMHMLITDPVYKAKYDKYRLENEKVFEEQIDGNKQDATLLRLANNRIWFG